MKKNKTLIYILAVIIGLIIVNVISSNIYKRFDLTKDKRYTLSKVSKSLVENLDAPLVIDVFLEGDFPDHKTTGILIKLASFFLLFCKA